jgi:FkbM family methyltransferase
VASQSGIVRALASVGVHRRLPYLSWLYARLDAAQAEAEATRRGLLTTQSERDAAQAEAEATRRGLLATQSERDAARMSFDAVLAELCTVQAQLGTTREEFAKLQAAMDEQARRKFVLTSYRDYTLLLDRTSPLDCPIISGGEWEGEQIERLFSYLPVVDTFGKGGPKHFIDIGAHWGLYALVAHRTLAFERIIAFEPDAFNRAQLFAQLMLNNLTDRIEVRDCALSHEVGSFPFMRSQCHPLGNRGGIGFASWTGPDTTMIHADLLDNQLPIRDAVLFAKMDVEGHESKVIAGGRKLLTSNEVLLQAEYIHPDPNEDRIGPLLVSLGFHELRRVGVDRYFTNVASITE